MSVHAQAVSDDDADEALAAAEESIRLTEAGAGDTVYSLASDTAAMLRAARGDHSGAARARRAAVAHGASTGQRSSMDVDVCVAALILAADTDTFEAAATLAGAVEPTLSVSLGWFTPLQRDRYQHGLAQAAATLGADRCTAAHQRGAAMTYDQTVAYTLDQLDRLAGP